MRGHRVHPYALWLGRIPPNVFLDHFALCPIDKLGQLIGSMCTACLPILRPMTLIGQSFFHVGEDVRLFFEDLNF